MTPYQYAGLIEFVLAVLALFVIAFVLYQNRHLWQRERRTDTFRTQSAPLKRQPQDHAVKLGTRIHIANVGAAHGTIVLVGWDPRWPQWMNGDFFIIFPNGDGSNFNTRYKIDRMDGRAVDHYFWAECSFAPRGA